jgi:hypothetical protein
MLKIQSRTNSKCKKKYGLSHYSSFALTLRKTNFFKFQIQFPLLVIKDFFKLTMRSGLRSWSGPPGGIPDC